MRYSEEEINLLKEIYDDPYRTLNDELYKFNNRTRHSLTDKAGRLGLKRKLKKNDPKCTKCGIKLIKDNNWTKGAYQVDRIRCKTCENKRRAKYTKKLRERAIQIMGGKCVKCGYQNINALQIDHIYDDGFFERKKGLTGSKFHNFLLELPEMERKKRYQLLCANCNWLKRMKKL